MASSRSDFNNIFQAFQNELELEAQEWHIKHFYVNFEEQEKKIHRKQLQELNIKPEQQHSCQVVTTTTTTTSRNYSHEDQDCRLFYDLPDYLSIASLEFRTVFFSELRHRYRPIDFEDLQHLALLIRQLSILHLYEQLWTRILQAGTGQLKLRDQLFTIQSVDHRHFSWWSKIVTSRLLTSEQKKSTCDVPSVQQHQTTEDTCIHFVKNYLEQIKMKRQLCQYEFDLIRKNVPDPIGTLDEKIEHYVQEEGDLVAIRFYVQAKLFLIEYYYFDRAYQWEYSQLNPTKLQLDLVQPICVLTLENEIAEQEMILLKFGRIFGKLPKFLNIIQYSLPTSLVTISDHDTRERLTNNYQKIIQRTKDDLTLVLATVSELKRDDCKKKLDRAMIEMWKKQHGLPPNERLTTVMIGYIERRQKNLITCIKNIYTIKDDFHCKLPAIYEQ